MLANGLRRMPRPLLVLALSLFAVASAAAQDPMRPWAGWKSLETPHFRIHFPEEYERWAIDVARRVEAVDSAITTLVGYRPSKRVDIVVHDPFVSPNGYVIPLLEATTTVWWATPPDPRLDIGNYRTWGEMLATHELAHVAHLTRPSRNGWERFKWSLLPASIGPIAQRAPRWVREGYATVIEGQITGSGRPNGAWRPAMLRQWALEGRLPTYTGLNAVGAFRGGDFAYLGGSAYLEWLLKRQGDSTLTHVWRRMTATTKRSFDQAFRGVYGDSPAALYGMHTAELTGDAMRAKSALQRAGLREGELVQRLNWETGDPSLSVDGKRLVVSLREGNKPSRLVVWNTEADSVARRRPTTRPDALDVPDKSFFPAARRVMRELPASNGTSYQYPRWFADNRRVMVTRWSVRPDGTFGPDLYIWNTSTTNVTRVTRGEGLLQADPSPDSREAVAMRCHEGHCDIVRYYFAIGSVTSLLEGSPTRSYYRPRFSPDGQRFVAAVSDSGRWQVVVADRDGKNPRRIGPADGANRYDAQWTAGGDSLVVVSERGGVPNLEYLSLDGGVKSITRVTGAAVAPDVNREDHSIWFLSLHSRGFDVRRMASDAPIADSVVAIDAQQYGFAGVRQTAPVTLGLRPGRIAEYYGWGPSKSRWLPGAFASPDGVGATFTIFRGDVVGRVGTTLSAAYGEPGTWRGASLRTVVRSMRQAIELGVHAFDHQPSKGREAVIDSDSLDARGIQGVAAVSQTFRREGLRIGARAGLGGGLIEPLGTRDSARLLLKRTRVLGFLDADMQLRQMSGSRGLMERVRLRVAEGVMRTHFRRYIATLQLASIGDGIPFDLSWTLGKHFGSRHTFEEFSIGGVPSATMDTSLMPQRWSMAMLPTATVTGRALQAWRIAIPVPAFTVYAEGASLTSDNKSDKFTVWNRAIGVEKSIATPVIPVSYAPAMQTLLGIGYSLDNPLKNKVRAYVMVRFDP
jgi:hypothetical protein